MGLTRAVGTEQHPGGRFGATLGGAAFGQQLVVNSVPNILLAVQIEQIDPADKALRLGIATGIAGLLVCLAQPTWGMVSDRSRSRFGRRAPFILGGAIVTAVGLLSLAVTDTFVGLLIIWCLTATAVTAGQAALGAVLPDRVSASARGVFAAVIGLGGVIGTLVGQIAIAKLVRGGFLLPYAVLAIVLVGSALLFVIVNPEPRADVPAAGRISLRALWIDPRRHPDFAWVLVSRFLVMTGFLMINGYLLYVLSDYVGLGRDRALHQIPLISAISLVFVIASLVGGGIWSDRAGRRKPFVFWSALVLGAGLILPLFVGTVPGMLASAAVIALGYGTFRAIDMAVVTLVLPSREAAAQHIGIAYLAEHLGAAAGPVLAGVVITAGGGYAALFGIAAACAVGGALCILPVRSVR
ncbi:MFS transporter [Nocardia sp. CDC160]|uniref:MFS transporter n=1 Tax=Nocardia sp. CDC160 TaxID=3112166 RepID=UPI002DBE8471|nr:MFS transporter [Nocardia sp. CDC160]MEC3916799.1 MFS transporter [Nocardia sp. CDC160]